MTDDVLKPKDIFIDLNIYVEIVTSVCLWVEDGGINHVSKLRIFIKSLK